jgi:glycosyltransferase involved in cell wall biosynthesis
MHIVAHNASPVLGGGEIWTALLLAGLQRRGHRVLLFCRNAQVAGRTAAYGIPTAVLRLGGDAMLPHALRFALRLRRLAPDALLLTTFKKIWLGGLGARLAGVPRVLARVAISTHLPRNFTYRVALRRWVDTLVVNAETIRTGLLDALPEADPRDIVTIHDGVAEPERRAGPEAVRRELGLPPEAQVIGSVARLVAQKRLDRLLHAVAALPERVHCVIAGEGPEREPIEALALRLGLRQRLHLLGFRTDVGDVLAALDVFVLSSAAEGMANAMLEAMAAGIPVVSTAVSGADEALGPGADGTAPGVIVQAGSAELAAALRPLLEDPGLRRRMGAAGRQRARERFGFERMLDRWEALLAGGAASGSRFA